MNWEAIGAIAESVGALGIIVTLAYLAIQIRQSSRASTANTRAVEASTSTAITRGRNDLYLTLTNSPELAELLLKGSAGYPGDLSAVDLLRFDAYMTSLFNMQEDVWVQWAKGYAPRDTVDTGLTFLAGLLRAPGMEEWWRRFGRKRFLSGVCDEIEAALEERTG